MNSANSRGPLLFYHPIYQGLLCKPRRQARGNSQKERELKSLLGRRVSPLARWGKDSRSCACEKGRSRQKLFFWFRDSSRTMLAQTHLYFWIVETRQERTDLSIFPRPMWTTKQDIPDGVYHKFQENPKGSARKAVWTLTISDFNFRMPPQNKFNSEVVLLQVGFSYVHKRSVWNEMFACSLHYQLIINASGEMKVSSWRKSAQLKRSTSASGISKRGTEMPTPNHCCSSLNFASCRNPWLRARQ
jgi:hypothetical protein